MIDVASLVHNTSQETTGMTLPRTLFAATAAVAALSLAIGPAHIASADTQTVSDSIGTQYVNSENITHGELYDTLKNSSLDAKDSTVDGQAITTFTFDDGISLNVPKPTTTSSGDSFGPQISGKINKNGEPVIYLNQNDQKRIKSVGKAAIAGILAVLPAGKVAKFIAGALGVSVADFIGSNGICKSGKSLRITGTPGGEAIKEMKCV